MRYPITPAAGALLLAVAAACSSGRATPTSGPAPEALDQAARADSVREHYTRADVRFMTGMIHHHAQALVMARMAPTHGASPSIRTLAERIINGQMDEIRIMQAWLRDRGEMVPDPMGDGGMARHGGHDMSHMAGMLSPEQMASLEAARGSEWDRLFLQLMIQHHQGALVMVDELFSTHASGQGDAIFKIASDINVDQATEIDRMQRMLEELLFGSG